MRENGWMFGAARAGAFFSCNNGDKHWVRLRPDKEESKCAAREIMRRLNDREQLLSERREMESETKRASAEAARLRDELAKARQTAAEDEQLLKFTHTRQTLRLKGELEASDLAIAALEAERDRWKAQAEKAQQPCPLILGGMRIAVSPVSRVLLRWRGADFTVDALCAVAESHDLDAGLFRFALNEHFFTPATPQEES